MTDRMATFFICDDVLVSMTGKLTILGMYGNELIIPSEQFTLNQLVIMFQMEARINNPFKKIALKVSLPGEDRPRIIEVPQPLPTTPPFGYIANEKEAKMACTIVEYRASTWRNRIEGNP
jgi:hypothetical protein